MFEAIGPAGGNTRIAVEPAPARPASAPRESRGQGQAEASARPELGKTEELAHSDKTLVLDPLFWRQLAFVGFLRQHIEPFASGCIQFQIRHGAEAGRIQASSH